MTENSILIQLENVWKIYQMGEVEVPALRGVTVEIKKGDFVAIMGASGSGKSTMMNLIGCLDTPTKGSIYLKNNDITKLAEFDLATWRGKTIGFIFQQYNLIPSLSAFHNVLLPLEFLEYDEGAAVEKVRKILDMVALGNKMHHLPTQLSGGQQQRVSIARSLATDPEIIPHLPAKKPAKHKVIIQCSHRNPFERALSMTGATLVQIGDAIRTHPADLESAIDEETTGVVFFLQAAMLDASMSLAETLEIAHAREVPVIVDAAAELPPKSKLWELAQRGADLVLFSGGKYLRGPQASGLMLGRQDLITSALAQSAPREHVVGRPLKAGKESILGLVAAVEAYLEEDEAARFAEWQQIAEFLEDSLEKMLGLRVTRYTPTQPYIQPAITPRVAINLDSRSTLTNSGLKLALREGDPSIAVEIIEEKIIINTHTLTMGEVEIIVQRIAQILK